MVERAIDVLARTVYGEAEGEPFDGKLAVAWVVLNRQEKPQWPNSVIEVCLQPKQFSCWNEGSHRSVAALKVDLDNDAFRDCYLAAIGSFQGYLPSPVGDADHYHAASVQPGWADRLHFVKQIQNHVFWTTTDPQT